MAYLGESRKDVNKFAKTIARRCVDDEFTLSVFHAGMISEKSTSFSSAAILDKQKVKWSTLSQYAKGFDLELENMKSNWDALGKYWPYSDSKGSGGISHRLKTGHPGNEFFEYVAAALHTYPTVALGSMRHGSEGMHLAGMFLAAYYAQAVTAPYFNVRGITAVQQIYY